MNTIKIEEKYFLEYIKDILHDSKIKTTKNIIDKYHHNSEYKDAASIIKNGILSLEELNKKGLKQYTKEQLKTLSDYESHVNGKDNISLSIAGMTDLYNDEDEYNPFEPINVDFIISNEIKATRRPFNYGNEFIHEGMILPDKIKAIDIRILELANKTKNINQLLIKYNYLKQIALSIKENKRDIPFREMSKEILVLDVDKISSNPTLILK